MSAKYIPAGWSISLDCECPKCHEYVDLLTAPDFWDGSPIEVGEHDTPSANALEVVCPECHHEFEVTCVY